MPVMPPLVWGMTKESWESQDFWEDQVEKDTVVKKLVCLEPTSTSPRIYYIELLAPHHPGT